MTKLFLLGGALVTLGCGPSPIGPGSTATNIVCPTGCPDVYAVVTFPGVPPDAPTKDRRDVPCEGRAFVPGKDWACR